MRGLGTVSFLLVFSLLSTQVIGSDSRDSFYNSLRRDTWDVGPEVFYHRYSETDSDGNRLMKETGVMYGLYLNYTYRDWISKRSKIKSGEGLMLSSEGIFSYGQVDYDGQLQNGTPYRVNGINDFIGELRLLIGHDSLYDPYGISTNPQLETIYTGIGYRYLFDKSSIDPAGYDRESNYLYAPLGVKFKRSEESNWFWKEVNIEVDWLIIGEQVSHLSDIGLSDVTNRQDKGYGFRLSVGNHIKNTTYDLLIEPFIRYWHIDDSEVAAIPGTFLVGIEPENETVEAGIRVVWRF